MALTQYVSNSFRALSTPLGAWDTRVLPSKAPPPDSHTFTILMQLRHYLYVYEVTSREEGDGYRGQKDTCAQGRRTEGVLVGGNTSLAVDWGGWDRTCSEEADFEQLEGRERVNRAAGRAGFCVCFFSWFLCFVFFS